VLEHYASLRGTRLAPKGLGWGCRSS